MAARKKAELADNGAAKTTKPKKAKAAEVAPAVVAAPAHDEIAKVAYQIFCERGGSAFDNWIEAERRLRG